MGKHNILFVDDDMDQREEFRVLFSREYHVHLAKDRTEALEILKTFRHHRNTPIADSERYLALAIIDQRLDDFGQGGFPDDWRGAEGLTLITYITTQVCRHTRVVLRTGYFSSLENRGHAAATLGAHDYWAKSHGQGYDEEQWLRDNISRQITEYEEAVHRFNTSLLQ